MEDVTHTADEHELNADGLPAEQEQAWFDVGDLARRYKTSIRHIYRLADNGRMPWGVKLGQLRRWSLREIEIWEAGGCALVRPARNAAERAKPQEGGRHV